MGRRWIDEASVSTTRSQAGLLAAQRALRPAQFAGDVAALHRLLDDR
jgi:hypothetical protein